MIITRPIATPPSGPDPLPPRVLPLGDFSRSSDELAMWRSIGFESEVEATSTIIGMTLHQRATIYPELGLHGVFHAALGDTIPAVSEAISRYRALYLSSKHNEDQADRLHRVHCLARIVQSEWPNPMRSTFDAPPERSTRRNPLISVDGLSRDEITDRIVAEIGRRKRHSQ